MPTGDLPFDLDDWLPRPQVRTRHRREAPVAPAALWTAASQLRLDETGPLARLVRWRIPGIPPDQTFRGLLADPPFTILAEGDGWSVSGLAGRIWTLRRDYPQLADAPAFAAWDERGTVRVLFAHWVQATEAGSILVSEARVQPVDRGAAARLHALWAVVGPWERLIGGEALTQVARRAQGG